MKPRRSQIRKAKEIERRSRESGEWGEWKWHHISPGGVGSKGWVAQITQAASNDLYSVLVRYMPCGSTHLAIRTISNLEPPWRDMQRIKDELGWKDRYAFQVCPPEDRIIDDADMYHLWIMPKAYLPGFALHPEDGERRR